VSFLDLVEVCHLAEMNETDAAASISVVDDHIFATVDAVEEGTVFIGFCKYKLMQ